MASWLAVGIMAAANASLARNRSQDAPPPPQPIDVIHYDATIDPDLTHRTVRGTVRIRLRALAPTDVVTLDRADLTIDAVHADGVAQVFKEHPRQVVVSLARPLTTDAIRDIEVAYHGEPRFGLQFPEGRSQVYTIFTTSQWMVSVDQPDDRATLRLRVTLPGDLTAAGAGRVVGPVTNNGGRRTYEWRLDAPAPTYTFGFAAGRFTQVTEGRLRFLGDGFSSTELRQVFAETAAMLRFFERRAGVPYPHEHYTQALVARTVGQEMSGLSLLSEAYGRAVLADPTAIALGAHEAAHQWWGNLLTCEAWTHFWVNEGMATFMAAAFMEERFGRPAYDRAVAGFRAEYDRVRNAGHDRSLVFPDWTRPSADDRTLVYQKGALVLHELRALLGDEHFWGGIRDYTRSHAGRSVTTRDLETTMEAAAGRNLDAFFDRWVYLRATR